MCFLGWFFLGVLWRVRRNVRGIEKDLGLWLEGGRIVGRGVLDGVFLVRLLGL